LKTTLQKISHFSNLTQEQRADIREKSKIAKKEKAEVSKSWKHDWKDLSLWTYLLKHAKIRSIHSYIHCSETKYIVRTLNKLGKDREWWKEHFGGKYSSFSENNPNVPMYALQGIMLEAAYPDVVNTFRNEGE